MQTKEEARRLLERPLEYPGLVERRSRVVRIWRSPSFDPESSWTIIEDKGEWYVRRVVYVQQAAADGFRHDTFASEGRLAEGLALSLIRDLRAIRIEPFLPLGGLGLDSVSYASRPRPSWRRSGCRGGARRQKGGVRFDPGIEPR
jgi:hypothetical protein